MTETSTIAVVTGGTAGVGRATVDMLLARGHRVAVLARGQGRLDELSAQYGDRVWTRSVDVADDAAVASAADAIAADLGAPEIWVNSVMLTSVSAFKDVDAEEFRKITDATYGGTVNGCRHALRVMTRGNIVNVGSGLSYRAIPFQAAYCGAKHAINGFTQAVRTEIMGEGRPIALSLVQLPAINTPQFDWSRNRMPRKPQPVPPIFQPEVAARGILKAIDEDAREVLVGRSVVQLVFGNMLLPDVLDGVLASQGEDKQQSEQVDYGRPDNLDGPLPDYPSKAHGSFDHQAEEKGISVDADRSRKIVAIGAAALLVGLGALAGRATAGRRAVSRGDAAGAIAPPAADEAATGDTIGVDASDRSRPWGHGQANLARDSIGARDYRPGTIRG